MKGCSANSLWIFCREWRLRTLAKITRTCPTRSTLKRAGRLPDSDSPSQLSNLRKRLLRGETVQLKAVGFSPFPTLKPQVVTVKLSHGGVDRLRMSGRSLKGDRFIVHPEVPAIAKLFVTVPDTKVWLTNPAPAGFLRWEGPILLPNDQLIRVDLLPGTNSGPAEPVGSKRQ